MVSYVMKFYFHVIRKLSVGQADIIQDEILPEYTGQYRGSTVVSIIVIILLEIHLLYTM